MRILDLLERDALLYARRPAVEVVGGPRLLHGELRERAWRVASGLAARGVERGDRVAVMADNGLLFYDAYLGAALLGAAAVPVNTRLAPREVAYQLGHCDPKVALAGAAYSGAVAAAAPPGTEVIEEGGREHAALLAAEVDGTLEHRSEGSDTGLVIYTSGTTGRPKGVCLSQHALIFNGVTIALAQALPAGEVFLTSTPLYHVATGTRITTLLLDGQVHVVMPRFEAGEWLDVVERHRVNSAVLVPTQLGRVLDEQAARPRDLASLRLLIYGAAPTAIPVIRRAMNELACGLYQGYGLSEACTNLTGLTPADHGLAREREDLLRSCGRAVPGVRVRVAAGPDGAGEIEVRTDKVMSGYWRDPEATAAAFRDGWLRTGDLGRLDAEGYLHIVGRAQDMIISGGVNVYPGEIEAVLGEHPAVAEVAVVGRPDPEWGEIPLAYVVARLGAAPDSAQLETFCRARLAGYKVPKEFRVVADLPRTATGKVRKAELAR